MLVVTRITYFIEEKDQQLRAIEKILSTVLNETSKTNFALESERRLLNGLALQFQNITRVIPQNNDTLDYFQSNTTNSPEIDPTRIREVNFPFGLTSYVVTGNNERVSSTIH